MLELHIRNERKIREMKIRIKYFEECNKIRRRLVRGNWIDVYAK